MTAVKLPPVLVTLDRRQREQIQETLANDEASTDVEIIDLWVNECSIPKAAADEAIKFRDQFLVDPFFDMFSLHPMLAAYDLRPKLKR
jgi:hypothetical protein